MADHVKQILNENKVVIFGGTYCTYCKLSKATLEGLKVPFKYVVLDEEDDGPEMRQAIIDQYNHKTIPAIFIGQKFIGGNDSLQALKQSGELSKRLSAVGVAL